MTTAKTRNNWKALCDRQDREDTAADVLTFIEGDDFHETFDEQAEVVAEALDLVLVTSGGVTRTGIPVGDDRSFARLVRMGYTVRIATAVAR